MLPSRTQRILFVVTRSDTIGGVHRYIISFLNILRDNGYSISVFCGFSPNSLFVKYLHDNRFDYHTSSNLCNSFSLQKEFRVIRELSCFIRKRQPDLVWSHSSKAGIIARFVCLMTHTKSLFTVHGWSFSSSSQLSSFYLCLEFLLSYLPSYIILISDYDYLTALKFKFNLSRAIVIHNSVPPPDCDCFAGVRRKKDLGRTSLVMVSRLSSQKDHITVLNALRLLNDSTIFLTIVGDGELRSELENFVIENNLSHNVNFVGYSDPYPFYASADAFVLSSHWEGFPLTSLEALSCSLPIVVSDVCGSSEVVIDGYNGYIFQQGNHFQLAECIARISSMDFEDYSNMRKYARLVYDRVFGFHGFVRQTISLVDSLLLRHS